MVATDVLERTGGPPAAMPLQRQWPQLGKELFTLESALTEHEPLGQREGIRGCVLAELYRNEGKHPRDARYRAFLVVEKGKAGEIVGNPYYVDTNGTKRFNLRINYERPSSVNLFRLLHGAADGLVPYLKR